MLLRRSLLYAPAVVVAGDFSPLDLTGLVAWYKADTGRTGSPITELLDQSGNGYTLTNSGTVPYNATGFNGFPAIDLGAGAVTGALVTASDTVAMGTGTHGSVFIVGQNDSAAFSNPYLFGYAGNGQGDNWGNTASAVFIKQDLHVTALQGFRNSSALGSLTISGNTDYRFGAIFDGTNFTPYLNNVAGTTGANSSAWSSPGKIIIGRRWNGGAVDSDQWTGPIAEIVLTNTALSSGDRDSLDAYFVAKYGL